MDNGPFKAHSAFETSASQPLRRMRRQNERRADQHRNDWSCNLEQQYHRGGFRNIGASAAAASSALPEQRRGRGKKARSMMATLPMARQPKPGPVPCPSRDSRANFRADSWAGKPRPISCSSKRTRAIGPMGWIHAPRGATGCPFPDCSTNRRSPRSARWYGRCRGSAG